MKKCLKKLLPLFLIIVTFAINAVSPEEEEGIFITNSTEKDVSIGALVIPYWKDIVPELKPNDTTFLNFSDLKGGGLGIKDIKTGILHLIEQDLKSGENYYIHETFKLLDLTPEEIKEK